jgi:hypothetical protein
VDVVTAKKANARSYRYVGIDWRDPEMRRAYNLEQQRAWREKNVVKKRRVVVDIPEDRAHASSAG